MISDVDLVIFDCDGVLVDSELLVTEVESAMLADRGISLTPHEVAERYVGLSTASMGPLILDEFGVEVGDDFFGEAAARVAAMFDERLRPVEGIADLLGTLAGIGHARCVASSSLPERIVHSLALTELSGFFTADRIFSASMVERGKPAPDLFLHAARECGVAPGRCLVLEDSVPGVTAARAAGMAVFGLTAASHCGPTYGDKLQAAGVDAVAGSVGEVIDLLGLG